MMADAYARFSGSLLSQPWRTRLQDFQGFTLAHPQLVEAKDELMAAIQGSPRNSLVMVVGPTGVGKTTLLAKAEQILTQSLVSALHTDRGRIPVVSVEAVAPESGSFNWRDQFKRILLKMNEPLLEYKLPRPAPRNEDNELHARLNSKIRDADYRYAVEQALRYQRPLAVLIDEAQHLAKMSSGRKLLDQLDVIKSIANLTGTVHVLFGTYDLLAFHNLNGQPEPAKCRHPFPAPPARSRRRSKELCEHRAFFRPAATVRRAAGFGRGLGIPLRTEYRLCRCFDERWHKP